ncbi:LysM peptidoglycan-binding domain-containing protein [Arthrobacter cryoconiti]|uniref:LysM peptidoglycan-binding domain-containing protein n=1 Tax=Arthrobacter cryoconiti TaxID=748907 RepID=A0ABV8QYN5_9MICC|nr:LysM peptidoglycan-binding domain-containing protein [Arthrobacter cryoconiti]MCC9068447.1 LysM peptidoglycan-binding domain-containing protein [Arthrobacter cryoconiti]
MKKQIGADVAMTATILCLGASMLFAGRSLLRLRLSGANANNPFSLEELIGALAAGLGIAVALWWLLALACAVISGVAQVRGRTRLASTTAPWSPAFMRRLVAAVLGLNLLVAPLAVASPTFSGPIDPQWHPTVATAPDFVSLTADIGNLPPQDLTAGVAPDINVPAPDINPLWTPQAPTVDPGFLVRPETRPSPAAAPTPLTQSLPPHNQGQASRPGGGKIGGPGSAGSEGIGSANDGSSDGEEAIVVKRGDTLWSIAAAALGPFATDVEVAQAWPQWYRTNRFVIGADPNVILPGQVLHAPFG